MHLPTSKTIRTSCNGKLTFMTKTLRGRQCFSWRCQANELSLLVQGEQLTASIQNVPFFNRWPTGVYNGKLQGPSGHRAESQLTNNKCEWLIKDKRKRVVESSSSLDPGLSRSSSRQISCSALVFVG